MMLDFAIRNLNVNLAAEFAIYILALDAGILAFSLSFL